MKIRSIHLFSRQLKHWLLGAISAVVLFTSASAQTSYVTELNRLDAINGQDELFKKLLAFEPFKRLPDPVAVQEVKETLDWLKKRGFWDPGSVRYTYNYAMWLWYAGVQDTSTAMFLFGTIKAQSDAARCLDETSAPTRIRDYESSLSDAARSFLQNKSQAIRDQVFQLATNRLEERLPHQKPDEWLCGGGMSFFNKYSQKHGNLEGKEVKVPNSFGKTFIVEDSSIKPDFVADTVWIEARRKATTKAVQDIKKFIFETTAQSK